MARTRAIWTNRRILRILIVRDLKVRYSDSVLGFAWTLLDPLLLTNGQCPRSMMQAVSQANFFEQIDGPFQLVFATWNFFI